MKKIFLFLVLANAGYFAWHELRNTAPGDMRAEIEHRLPGNVRTVALLKERGRTSQPAMMEPPATEGLLLGGFSARGAIEALEQRLLTLGVRADRAQTEHEVETEYWVYMPPLASRNASLRQLRELQARKLDSFLITQGELENGISLGIYPTEALAQGMQERMRSAGYASQIKAVVRKQIVYWLRIDPLSRRLVDEQMLKRLSDDFPGLQHQVLN